jgi:hypothetical protein
MDSSDASVRAGPNSCDSSGEEEEAIPEAARVFALLSAACKNETAFSGSF